MAFCLRRSTSEFPVKGMKKHPWEGMFFLVERSAYFRSRITSQMMSSSPTGTPRIQARRYSIERDGEEG